MESRFFCVYLKYKNKYINLISNINNMATNFKKCPNGHYYQGDFCPYCKSAQGPSTNVKTEIFVNPEIVKSDQPTLKTQIIGTDDITTVASIEGGTVDENTTVAYPSGSGMGASPMRTVFGEEPTDTVIGTATPRFSRKLVGWLVSYTLNELGVDFKLYEGRNIIGRDQECNITINDGKVSSKHAVILFRAGKYSISDMQSSHGTFVNSDDIELEPRYLNDGDLIRMGNTILKFRSAL